MLEYKVNSKAELIAAISASAQPTYAEARNNPVKISLGSTKYRFEGGIHEERAKQVINNIRRLSAQAFDVAST